MAYFLVRNSLSPNKVAKFGVTFTQVTPKNNEGDPVWAIEVTTSALDSFGKNIRPTFVTNITDKNLRNEIEKAISFLASKIDWTPLVEDQRGPILDYLAPSEFEIKIDDNIELGLYEILPSAGIDKDSIKLVLNGLDVSSELEITGDPFRYKVKWSPFLRVYKEE